MKKRLLSLGLALCLLLTLLPFGASALDGPGCFRYLKEYLLSNGTIGSGVYTYTGVEQNEDVSANITLTCDPNADTLVFGMQYKEGSGTYSASMTVPAAAQTPYDAEQTIKRVVSIHNTARITSEFTRGGALAVEGETYDLPEVPQLFANAVALMLRHVQDNLLQGSDYSIADLGFAILMEELYALDHEVVLKNAKPATCTAEGYSGDEYCAFCERLLRSGETIPAAGHQTETQNAKDASCTAAGYTGDLVCTVCGETVKQGEAIPAPGHKTETQNAKDATCTDPGYSGDEVCTVCGETVRWGAATPALGHAWDDGTITRAPTVTEAGERTFACTRPGCGASYTEPIPKLDCDHDYQAEVVPPTCTTDGYTRHTCRICGASYQDTPVAAAHQTELQGRRDAACAQEGYTGDLVCTVCGETVAKGKTIPALGHKTETRNAKDASCTEAGYTGDLVCTVCGETVAKGKTIPALGHKTETRNAKEASCTEAGYTGDLVCTVCGETVEQGRAIPVLPHKTELRNAKDATETAPGYTGDLVCTVCGTVVKQGETIPALGPKTCPGGDACPSRSLTDVDRSPNSWSHEPIDWAFTTGVTTGVSATKFGPGENCTRAQMVTFLWRAKGEPEPARADNPFADVKPGQYYYKAVLWAVGEGITNGTDKTHFSPDSSVTRGQTVTFLWRMEDEPEAAAVSGFSDVPASQYYARAVTWAVAEAITNGVGGGRFAPDSFCTRAEIVTFLWRDLAR